MSLTITEFTVSGGFDISSQVERVLAYNDTISAYKLPDGRTVRLVVALEVESADGTSYEYLTSESNMDSIGFTNLDYQDTSFTEIEV